ncbi:hypothetical protein D3C76_1778510 [compost metagenome]
MDFVQPGAHEGAMPGMIPEQVPFPFDHRVLQFIRKPGMVGLHPASLNLIRDADTRFIHDQTP